MKPNARAGFVPQPTLQIIVPPYLTTHLVSGKN
ncbi:hypothetical protein NIES932_03480 [Raphidiopsis curvata NIES-932]|nr:hypothetical protein NIES932_03480 [Raphidiopsis curvata NIES-932]